MTDDALSVSHFARRHDQGSSFEACQGWSRPFAGVRGARTFAGGCEGREGRVSEHANA